MGLPGVSLGFPGVSLGKTRDSPSAPPCRITVVHTWKPGFSGEPAGCFRKFRGEYNGNSRDIPWRYLGMSREIPWRYLGMLREFQKIKKKAPALTGGVLEGPG